MRISIFRCLLSFSLLAAMLPSGLSLAQPDAAPVAQTLPASPGDPLIIMPPHPRLKEQIDNGTLLLPEPVLPTEDRLLSPLGSSTEKSKSFANMDPQPVNTALTGQLKALAVLVQFSDKVHTVQASFFDSLIFAAPVSGRGSVRDYFNEVSYGQVDIVTLNLPSSLGWRTAPQAYSSYTNNNFCLGSYDYNNPKNCQKLAEDIAQAIDGVVDFSQYDNNNDGDAEPLMIVHAGPGAEFTGSYNDVWSHSWSMVNPEIRDGVWVSDYVIMPEYWMNASPTTSDMTIGVFAHEMAHGFWNLPDLYDYDGSSQGVGDWSLMAGGSWNGHLNMYGGSMGDSPAWPDAWSRLQMGFDTSNLLNGESQVSVFQAAGSLDSPKVYQYKTAPLAAQEYFLIENRQRISGSYDEYLPGSGLLIWHIDEAKRSLDRPNDVECEAHPNYLCGSSHPLVALEQADGLLYLEKNINQGDGYDPFPGLGNKRAFSTTTNPGSHSYYNTQDSRVTIQEISDSGLVMTFTPQISVPVEEYKLFLPAAYHDFKPNVIVDPYSADFEGNVFPPPGWTVQSSNINQRNWTRSDIHPNSGGDYHALVEYVVEGEIQDEYLISPNYTVSSAMVEVYTAGSLYWCRDYYDNCDLNLWVIYGPSIGGGDDIKVRNLDGEWIRNFEYVRSNVDLSPYITAGVPFRIAFQYVGEDTADVYLDDFNLIHGP